MQNLKEKASIVFKKRLFYTILCCIFITQVISRIALGYIDTDTYFILAEGRDIVTNGIKYINTFTVVPDLKIVVQQWLWCVIIYSTYEFAGNAGLFAITIIEAVAIVVLFYKLGKKKCVDATLLAVLDIVFLFLLSEFISTRPNAITIILLLLELLCLESYKEKDTKAAGVKLSVALTAIQLLEINLHASMWVFHFLFLLPYVFPPIKTFATNFNKREYNIKPILAACIPMALVLFINPYGLDGILYLFNSYGEKLNSIGIAELQNVKIASLSGAMLIISLVFYVGCYMAKSRPLDAEIFYLFAGTFILGCVCYRNYYYAAIGFFMLIVDVLKNTNFEKIHDFINKQSKAVIMLAMLALAVTVCYAVNTGAHRDADWVGEPIAAVKYLDENAETGSAVYTEFNNGAFMEWAGYKVYIDARPELYLEKINNKEDVLDEFLDVYYSLDREMYSAFVQKYHFDYFLVTESSLMDAFLQCDEAYQVAVDGEGYRLYASR